jgi:hypothetical protein
LANIRGIQQDGLRKRSIATQIKHRIDSVTAVLVLANGAVPRLTVGSDYALVPTLSAIFPKSLARNTAFLFTNVENPLHWNFSRDTLPGVLKTAPQFLLNNPIALQMEYSKFKDNPNMNNEKARLRNVMRVAKQNALEMLVDLFDWSLSATGSALEGGRTYSSVSPTTERIATTRERPRMRMAEPAAFGLANALFTFGVLDR